MRTQSLKTKAIAAIAATAMLCGVGALTAMPAYATMESTTGKTGSITITGDNMSVRQFKAWRILNYDKADTDATVSDVVASIPSGMKAAVVAGANAVQTSKTFTTSDDDQDIIDVITGLTGNTSANITTPSAWGKSTTSTKNAYDFAAAVLNVLQDTSSPVTPTITTGTGGFVCNTDCVASGQDLGYYLIVEDSAKNATTQNLPITSYVLLASLHNTAGYSVAAKSQTPTSDKYITTNTNATSGATEPKFADGTNDKALDGTTVLAKGTPTLGTGEDSTVTPDFQIGQDIYYTLQYEIPASYARDFQQNGKSFTFTLQDKLSKGLNAPKDATLRVSTITDTNGLRAFTLNADSDSSTKESEAKTHGLTDATSSDDPWKDGSYTQWTITVGPDDPVSETTGDTYKNISNYTSGATVYLTYKTQLNANAKIAGTGNPNEFNVRYQRQPGDTNDESHTQPKTPRVYTYALSFEKVQANQTATKLPGAHFCLSTSDNDANCQNNAVSITEDTADTNGAYHVTDVNSSETAKTETIGSASNVPAMITADTSGALTIKGLDAGTYYLYETQAPTGYTIASPNPLKVVISSDNGFNYDATEKNKSFPKGSTGDNGSADNDAKYSIKFAEETTAGTNFSGLTAAPTTAYQISNPKTGTLPITGGQGIALAVIVGLGLVGVGAIVTKRSRKADAEA